MGCGGGTASGSSRTQRPGAHRGKTTSRGDIAGHSRRATLNRKKNWSLTSGGVTAVAPIVRQAASTYNLPEDLIYGIIWVESRFNPRAKSGVGARGLMQLMPRTASYLAEKIRWDGRVDSTDPSFNITAGAYYISELIRRFDGQVDHALAAYNAGPAKVRRWLAGNGLPKVSVEYHTMVQTARGFFRTQNSAPKGIPAVPSTAELDRLGLAILIAGLSDVDFGLERIDSANPFQ